MNSVVRIRKCMYKIYMIIPGLSGSNDFLSDICASSAFFILMLLLDCSWAYSSSLAAKLLHRSKIALSSQQSLFCVIISSSRSSCSSVFEYIYTLYMPYCEHHNTYTQCHAYLCTIISYSSHKTYISDFLEGREFLYDVAYMRRFILNPCPTSYKYNIEGIT